MDHGDGSDHFHHSCCRYIHRLPKVSKVGIYYPRKGNSQDHGLEDYQVKF